MDTEQLIFKHNYYIRKNENNEVIKYFSDFFEDALNDDILVGRGNGCQFRIGKNKINSSKLHKNDRIEKLISENGLDLETESGIFKYKYVGGKITKKGEMDIKKEEEIVLSEQNKPVIDKVDKVIECLLKSDLSNDIKVSLKKISINK